MARVWAPTIAMGAEYNMPAAAWKVGGPLIGGLTVAHDSIVFVVAKFGWVGVDAHYDPVVVMWQNAGMIAVKSMFAASLIPV